MIKIQDSVPSIYYDTSRDFQLIGHLFDLVLNSVKTEADLLFSLPFSTNSDDQLLDLLAFTLGLRLSKDKYTSAQLRAVCSVAPRVMRTKGSIAAIELLCTALMRADSVEGQFSIELSEDRTKLTVYITNAATCKDLLNELLPYIVPAGIVFNIKGMTAYVTNIKTDIKMLDTVNYNTITYSNTFAPLELDDTTNIESSLLFEPGSIVTAKDGEEHVKPKKINKNDMTTMALTLWEEIE